MTYRPTADDLGPILTRDRGDVDDAPLTPGEELAAASSILDRADTEGRELTAEESAAFDGHLSRATAPATAAAAVATRQARASAQRAQITAALARGTVTTEGGSTGGHRAGEPAPAATRAEVEPAGDRWVRSSDGAGAVVTRGTRFAEHPVVRQASRGLEGADAAVVGQHGSFGNLVRAMTTTSGSAVVPTTWAGDLIDRARNYAAVLQAGAQIVPMDAKTVQIGRLTADPTAAFRTEGSAITASDPTFDNVTLTAQTMSALVIGSLEWFQDADNVDAVVSDAVARAIGLQLDLVSLFGGMTTGNEGFNLATPPNPRGVLASLIATASTSVLGAATNGTTQTTATYWNEVLDTIFQVRDFNEQPTGLIWNSKAARQYAKAYDTTGQPLAIPADVAAVPRYVSNQIPSFTAGTMTSRATDVFAGDWTQLLIGQRLGLTIQTLTERYAENGQIGIVAHWRGDVQLARPRAFAVYRYLQGA